MVTKENVICFPGSINISLVRQIEARLNYLVDFRGFDRIVLDFSQTQIAFPESIVPIVCCALRHQTDGVKFRLVLPKYDKLARLFTNCGWSDLIAPNQPASSNLFQGNNIPALRFFDQSQQDAIVNRSIDMMMKLMPYLDRNSLRAVEWSINEICDNVLNHSESRVGGIFQLNFRPSAREVEFIVADAGVGIPDSLRSSRYQDWTDATALEQSIRQGVTRDPEHGQGNGLYGTYQIAALSGGTFHINSGYAHLVVTREGNVQVRIDQDKFIGTLVVCAFNCSRPQLLERALAFKGGDYRMVDIIDLKYDDDKDSIQFFIRQESESLGSRRAGLHVRRKIQNLLSMTGANRLTCDFTGVTVMSSSFADEAFGKLASELGVKVFQSRINMTHLSLINKLIVERAIRQRLGINL